MSQPRNSFATTQWTLVWQAASDDSNYSRPAMEQFIQKYWQPLYQFARFQGMSSGDAEDATQEFLTRILDGRLLANADPFRGRFRSYLLTAWKRFLIDQYRQQSSQKVGGDRQQCSLDMTAGEELWKRMSSYRCPAEQGFSVAWATTLLEQAKANLAQDYSGRSRETIFKLLWPLVTRPLDQDDYQQLAQQLTMTVSAVKVAMHRLRQRFGLTLRNLIEETVEDPREVDAELNELIAILKARS